MTFLQDHCFGAASRCCDYLKKIFSSTGATSGGISYASGDVGGALSWAKKELGELEGVINARGDYCAMIGSRGMAFMLEKAGCEHIKAVSRTDFSIDIKGIKKPSKEVLNAMKQFFVEI